MANFSSKDVLTISGSVIAGLLILLTLQSLSTNLLLTKLVEIQSNYDDKVIQLNSDISTMTNLKAELTQITDPVRKAHIESQIDDLQMQAFQLQAEIDGFKNKQSQWTSQTNQLHIVQNIQVLRLTILFMVSPFALAVIVESSASLKGSDPANEHATRRGKKLLVIGGIVLICGLGVIFSSAFLLL